MSAIELGEPLTIGCPGAMGIWLEQQAGNVEGAASLRHELGEVLGERIEEGLAGICLACLDAYGALADGDADTAIGIVTGIIDALLQDGVVYPTSIFIPFLAIAQMVSGDLEGAQRTVDRLRASPTTSTARLQSRMLITWPHWSPGGKAVRIWRADGARRADDVPPAGVAATAVEALDVVGGCLVDLGNASGGLRLLAASTRIATAEGWGRIVGGRCPPDDGRTSRGRPRSSMIVQPRCAPRVRRSRSNRPSSSRCAPMARASVQRADGRASAPPSSRSSPSWPRARRTLRSLRRSTISRATVKTHVSHVLTKLGLGSRSEIAAEFARRGSLG